MNNSFYQRDWFFNKKEFTLTEQGLQVKTSGLFKANDFFVRFEDIGVNKIRSSARQKAWLIVALILFTFFLFVIISRLSGGQPEKGAELFYLIGSSVCLLIFFLHHKKSFYLVQTGNANALEFLTNKPSKMALDKFLSQLKAVQKEILLEKYGQLNLNLSYESQYNNLTWLRNQGILSQTEFKQMQKELDKLFPVNGFRFGINEN